MNLKWEKDVVAGTVMSRNLFIGKIRMKVGYVKHLITGDQTIAYKFFSKLPGMPDGKEERSMATAQDMLVLSVERWFELAKGE